MTKRFRRMTQEEALIGDGFVSFLKDERGNLIDFSLNEKHKTYATDNDENSDGSLCKIRKQEDIESLVVVTPEVIGNFEKTIRENAPEGLKEMSLALKAAVKFITPSKNISSPKYAVDGLDAFTDIITTSTNVLAPTLLKYLSHGSKSKTTLPSSSLKWKNIESTLQEYLSDALNLLETEGDNLELILNHSIRVSLLYTCYPKLTAPFVKKILEMRCTPNEDVRSLVHQCLVAVLPTANEHVARFTFGKLYMEIMSNCKQITESCSSEINKMKKSLVEYFLLKPKVSLHCVSIYLQQMRKALDSAAASDKKEAKSSVNNWQFCQSLSLWADVVGAVKNENQFKKLIKPLVDLVLDTIKLNLSATFLPMRLFCARILINLSQMTGLFIPTLPIILEPLQLSLFEDEPHISTSKPLIYSTLLCVNNSQLYEKIFLDKTVDEIMDLLLQYSTLYSSSIAFPELMLPVVKQLKSFVEKCAVPSYNKKFEQLGGKIKVLSDKINKKRKSLEVNLKDETAVKNVEKALKQEGKELEKFYEKWLNEKSETAKVEIERDESTEMDLDSNNKELDNEDDDDSSGSDDGESTCGNEEVAVESDSDDSDSDDSD